MYSAATANLTRLETLAEQTSDPLVAALLTIAKGNYYLAGGDDGLARAVTLLADGLDTYEATLMLMLSGSTRTP
ncbi:hypothetical protein [Nocardia sp. NPDC049526]|uniref:hypothetical protein n=1 Tax=Nocardia sp. NPDC049526 TaxID=3364316 RepID=UPI0037888BA2